MWSFELIWKQLFILSPLVWVITGIKAVNNRCTFRILLLRSGKYNLFFTATTSCWIISVAQTRPVTWLLSLISSIKSHTVCSLFSFEAIGLHAMTTYHLTFYGLLVVFMQEQDLYFSNRFKPGFGSIILQCSACSTTARVLSAEKVSDRSYMKHWAVSVLPRAKLSDAA